MLRAFPDEGNLVGFRATSLSANFIELTLLLYESQGQILDQVDLPCPTTVPLDGRFPRGGLLTVSVEGFSANIRAFFS